MRWKLLLASGLIAGIVGTGLSLAVLFFTSGERQNLWQQPRLWVSLLAVLLPFALFIYTAIFVYRHTARRRRLQAFLSVALAALTFSLLMLLNKIL